MALLQPCGLLMPIGLYLFVHNEIMWLLIKTVCEPNSLLCLSPCITVSYTGSTGGYALSKLTAPCQFHPCLSLACLPQSTCIVLITLKSASELTLIFMITRTLDLNIGDIVRIKVEPFAHIPNIKNENSHINRGSTH